MKKKIKKLSKLIYLIIFIFLIIFSFIACPQPNNTDEYNDDEEDEIVEKSSDSSLKSLSFSSGALDPAFDTTRLNYNLLNWNSPLSITATTNDSSATLEISINGSTRIPITSGVEYPNDLSQDLKLGNNSLAVIVNAEDQSNTIYFISIVKQW